MTGLHIEMYAEMDIGKREEHQDSVNASFPDDKDERGVLCAVADGVGGLINGKAASQAAVDKMVDAFYRSSAADPPGQILLRGLASAQKAVRGLQQTPGESGTTLVAVIIRDQKCSFISVGDSRIYLYRGGSLILLTRDQNRGRRIDTQIGLGRLPDEARRDRKRSALTAYVGMEDLTQADRCSQPFSVGPGDRLILVTDGVWGMLTEKEITEVMRLPVQYIPERLIEKTLSKGSPYQDNCAAAVISCDRQREGEEGG